MEWFDAQSTSEREANAPGQGGVQLAIVWSARLPLAPTLTRGSRPELYDAAHFGAGTALLVTEGRCLNSGLHAKFPRFPYCYSADQLIKIN